MTSDKVRGIKHHFNFMEISAQQVWEIFDKAVREICENYHHHFYEKLSDSGYLTDVFEDSFRDIIGSYPDYDEDENEIEDIDNT
jgi:hypothetical protein